MIIQVTTDRGAKIARLMAMSEVNSRDVHIHLIFDVPGSAEKRYWFRARESTR